MNIKTLFGYFIPVPHLKENNTIQYGENLYIYIYFNL